MAKEKVEKDGKEKKNRKDKKEGKDKDKENKKGVTFVHERLTGLPPPRYPLGQEPSLPPWPITWTPTAICLESSVPGLSIDILAENFNKLSRPGMSMAVVHPKDLAEDEMAIDGTVLAEMLKKAKEESNASWPPSSLLSKCLKSRSVLDRDDEHRKEEVRRANAVAEAKHSSEDLKAKLSSAKEEVTLAETKLRDYRIKLVEEMRARKAERKLASKAANNKADTTSIGETEMSKGGAKQTEPKDKKLEDKGKREGKGGKKQDNDKPGGKAEKGRKGKEGEGAPEPALVPIVSPHEQFKLFEEDVASKRAIVKELEAKLLSSVEKEATMLSMLLEPFTTGRLYCILGMDSASSVVELACEEKSFFKAIFNVAPRPKDSTMSLASEGPDKAKYHDVPALMSSSKSTDAKMDKRADKKEAKLAKKEAKAAAVATATPPLVAEIKAIVENGSMLEPARSVCVVDVFYETSLPPKTGGEEGESQKQEKEAKKQKDDVGDEKRKEDGQNKKEKKSKAGKEDQKVKHIDDEEEQGTKGKKSKSAKKAVGAKDETLPYEQVAQAVALAVERLLLQVQLYGAMGGDKVKVVKVPVAKPLQGEDRSYYNHLLNEFPQGLVTVPIVVHCLLEQVATYHWSVEDLKALEVSNLNKQMRNGIYHEFEKRGHPKWIGVTEDIEEGIPTRFEGPYNDVNMKTKDAWHSNGAVNDGVEPGSQVQEKAVDSVIKLEESESKASATRCCDVHGEKIVACAIHESHCGERDEPLLRKSRVTKVHDPSVQAKDLEDKLEVTHELDSMSQLSATLTPFELKLPGSINATTVGQHLSLLRATPARSRYKMPGTPMHSEEKMGASLTALQDLCDHYEDEQPKFQTLEDALFHCKAPHISKGVDISTMQRYKKLTTFLEMIKEDKDVFPDLDIPVEEISEPDNVTKGPYNMEGMKYWCSNCLEFFQRPDVVEKIPKEPLTEEDLRRLKKLFKEKMIEDYEKRQLDKDNIKESSKSLHEDAFTQEMIEAGIFPKRSKSEQLKDEASSERELDPRMVKMWCEGCQSVFLPPPPPTLEELWEQGRRMREEMERLAARDAQAVVDAKIEAWKRLEHKIRKSIVGRQHAEGFADGLMGEVFARSKLHLPFEIIKYDHDEDCILACHYAANAQRNVQEQIPCLMPFGDFCATYDVASGEPIKKRYTVYEMEPQYNLVLDERRYLLTEQQGLVVCGLPAKSPVQYEPRVTLYKDGNVIMLRAIKALEKSGQVQEAAEMKTGLDLKNEGAGDEQATTGKKEGKKEGKDTSSKKEASKKDKAKKGKEGTDLSEPSSGVVQEQVFGEQASVPPELLNENQGLGGTEPFSPARLELERSVIACLKDGLIATFFFAQDGTLHLQINIPAGGRTFEITSNGVVIFLPLEVQKQDPKPASSKSASSDSPAPESVETSKDEEKGPNREESSPKEKTKRDKSQKKGKEHNAEKDGEAGGKLKKNAKPKPDMPEQVENEDVEPGKRGDEGQLVNDLELMNSFYQNAVGDIEVSRCILPSGTVVSYKENGYSQILCNNGNVSEYKTTLEDTLGWVTTNNKGFCVLQDPPTKEPELDDEVPLPEDNTLSSKSGKGKKRGAEKAAKQQDQEEKLEKDPKPKDEKTSQNSRQNDGKKDKKAVSFAEQDDFGVSVVNPVASDPNLPPVATERCHVQLPSKKVVEIFDPDSGSSITTREDLVVVINTSDNTVRLVQHADGTHIYSEVREGIKEYNPSAGRISLEQTKQFSSSNERKPRNPPVETEGSSPPGAKLEMAAPTSRYITLGGSHIRDENEISFTTKGGEQTKSGVLLATQGFHAKRRVYSTQWHVRKEGFPSVQGNTNGGVAVEFSTTDGQYCVTWSRESGIISVLMPSGSMIYSCGKLVSFDPSDGKKRLDPKQSLHNHPIGRPPFINTNGIYEFDLERANLTFTDNSGNGFRSSWGYKIELITGGVLQKSPEPVDPLKEVSISTDGEEDSLKTDGMKDASLKAASATINSEVPLAISNNKEPSANGTGRSKTLQVQPVRSSQVGRPLSPISESPTIDSDVSLTMTDLGQISESGTVGQQSSVSDNEETDETEEVMLGPAARLFVIHEGGFGFEIIHENEFNKYTSSKKWNKDCTHVREVYEEVSATLHTFVTVKEKAKKLADVFAQAQEGCRAPDVLKLWTTKVSEFARRIKLRAMQTKMHKRTKCDWLQLSLNLPYLPRVVAPDLLPVLPLSNVTKVVFRQIFEYPSFDDEQIPKMDRILEKYNKWQESAMILTDVEQNPDTRTPEEIKQALDVANTIREVRAEKKLHEARDRAAVEVQHAKEIFRKIMNAEADRLQKFEESKNELRRKGESDWLEYKESKKGPLPCLHKPCDILQIKGPYRPNAHMRLCYFECEEGLQYIISLQYQQWQQYPEDPRRWSLEALPPFSYSYQGSSASQTSAEQDAATSVYDVPCMTPKPSEEIAQHETPCLLSEWMRELEKKPEEEAEDDEGKMCWELIKPKRKELGPADWTPCFLVGFDEKCEETDAHPVIDIPEIAETRTTATTVEEVVEEPCLAEEIGALIPLPKLPRLWGIPTGKEWEINHEAVQRQSELIPNFPGWRKACWRKNKAYLDVNSGTLLGANISSIGTLRNRPHPPKDWSHQFLVVPDFLDFGTVEYGTISMKVLFLQNYHGTEPGRFRFDNLGECVKFSCEFGMVPPGLTRAARIFFRASALGEFSREIRISTQYDVFEVPIFATVVCPEGYCAPQG